MIGRISRLFGAGPLRPLRLALFWSAVLLGGLAIADSANGTRDAADVFFWRQDLAILIAGAAVCLTLLAIPGRLRDIRFPERPLPMVVLLALACVLAGWGASHVAHLGFPLSMDEFMARFDARSFGRGKLFGELPEAWREYAIALQPLFQLDTPSDQHWSSAYLPLNAAFRALGGLAGLEALVNPAWTGVAVMAVYGVARRLWPERRDAALVAVVLTATSAQLLAMSLSSYAMPAHLVLNLVWLWFFLRGGWAGHAAALATAFVACGLHQVVFHPLFVAPFILQLWLDRRWPLAGLYTVAYGLIGLFWISYWPIAFEIGGVEAPVQAGAAVGGAAAGAGGFLGQAWAMIDGFNSENSGLMAKNLVRFVTWQNPLMPALALLGGLAALKTRGHLRSLALGILGTVLFLFIVLPPQGHGWGYRYLHGFIGSACLLAAWQWMRFMEVLEGEQRRRLQTAFVVATVLAVVVLMPLRAWQIERFVAPTARAQEAISAAEAEVVVVDDRDIWYGIDLVRNDPFLRQRPVVLRLAYLSPQQVDDICGAYSVAVFDASSARRVGLAGSPQYGEVREKTAELRARMDSLGCGTPIR